VFESSTNSSAAEWAVPVCTSFTRTTPELDGGAGGGAALHVSVTLPEAS
jgi:hypothetical protein